MCKYAENPKVQEDFGNNPIMNYYYQTKKEMDVILPILSKIYNKTLPLVNYQIGDGVCGGLGHACKANPKLINTVILDSNGLLDESLAKLLRGMQSLDHVKSIVYKNNDF